MDDSEIINLYFDRSQAAIAETGRKYGAYLNRIAYNILFSGQDAEEVVNDTYLAAWNTIPPERPAVLRHYLSRITRNLSFKLYEYNHAAKRNSSMDVMLSELEECLPDTSSVEGTAEARELTRIIDRWLGTLNREDCAIFVTRYYYAETVQRTAARLKLSQRRVKYRLSVMRKELRQELMKEGIRV